VVDSEPTERQWALVTESFHRLALENRSIPVGGLVVQDEGAVLLNGEIWNCRDIAVAEGFTVTSEYDLVWQLYRPHGGWRSPG
jgi:hypothetical protein